MQYEQIQENGISRRGFLKRTALAGAAICIVELRGLYGSEDRQTDYERSRQP